MTLARLLPFHIHGALEVVLASLLMAAPFLLGFEPAAGILSVTLGVLLLGVVFASHATDERALPISTHAAFDAGLAIVMAVGALTFGLSSDALAGAFLGLGSVLVVLLSSLTRYSVSTT
jgi:hypothetical protein